MATATWQDAPLLVQKNESRSKYRLAIYLRPANAATMKKSWPMPHLDSEILYFKVIVFFAVLNFVSAYFQLPLNPDSYETCRSVGTKGFIVSKLLLPEPANATSYFQSTVEPLFCGRRYLGPTTGAATKGGQVFLPGTLDREATKETPLDGVSVMGNRMLGRRSLVFPKVWQPGCRL